MKEEYLWQISIEKGTYLTKKTGKRVKSTRKIHQNTQQCVIRSSELQKYIILIELDEG